MGIGAGYRDDRLVRARRKQGIAAERGSTGDGQRLAQQLPPPGVVIVLAHGAVLQPVPARTGFLGNGLR